MAVAIMAVLAVVGFGFASSMKLEYAATQAIRNLSQARMGAHAALQLFAGALGQDSMSDCSATAGPAADHVGEACFGTGVQEILVKWGNLSVWTALSTDEVNPIDEARKLNLNAFGNVSKWDYSQRLSDGGSLPGAATDQLYHGANQRFSSFEVSFEEFFFRMKNTLWDNVSEDNGRIRAANLARAICLYRYGGKRDADEDGEPDYQGDGKPGADGVDDDKDNDFGSNGTVDEDNDGLTTDDPDEVGFGLKFDGIDNDGDGEVDEATEGIDEPDEFNPFDPDGDGSSLTVTGTIDDRAFLKIEEFKAAISRQYTITGSHEGTAYTDLVIPAAVAYDGSTATTEEALDALDAEADRIYKLVKHKLTVYSYSLNARSVSVDAPGRDGYDNDGDGKVDEDDGDADSAGIPATTIADIKKQLDASISIYDVDINEKKITKAAQAAFIYWKLANVVKGFTVQTAVDMVDFRDTDCVPTTIPANALDTTATPNQPSADTHGFDSLHITEVGRYVAAPTSATLTNGDWAWDAGTGTAATNSASATDLVLSFADLKVGKYLLKFTIQSAVSNVEFRDSAGGNLKTATGATPVNQSFFYGPLIVSTANQATIKIAPTSAGQHTLKNFQVILPYIEITNYSRQWHDMTQYKVRIGTKGLQLGADINPTTVSITNSMIDVPGSAANGTPPTGQEFKARFIPPISPGHGFDEANRHGPYYGYFVIVYDKASFANNFSMGSVDFPVCEMPGVFGYGGSGHGFDGKQDVKLLDESDKLVAGGKFDGFADSSATYPGIGECAPFSSATKSASRLIASGPLQFTSTTGGTVQSKYRIRPETTPSPGRWNSNDGKWSDSGTANPYPELFWPSTNAAFRDATGKPDLVVLSDAGYYRSPGEVGDLPAPKLWASTLSFCPDWQMNDGTRQPLFKELLAFVVAARAPARINLNTATEPSNDPWGQAVLRAATLNLPPDVATLTGAKPFISVEDLGLKAFMTTQYIDDGADSNDDNVEGDYNELEEWYKLYSNVITLRSHCFRAVVIGEIKTENGDVLAKYKLRAVCDRGRKVDSNGRPLTTIVSIKPGSSD